ncbi:chorismate lyase [Neisseria sp. N95_16]|uniref:Chorismate lyase n=1 Tax=Neisseria brasiliensis TaxID=2666100 RepID=A0A5Q3RWS9_9NEIS|nr:MULTISPECIES: chorismate lyase [Neisseria]MRN37575.1 chorismate lyase [Neisseria brasiliensis]PJO09277.1 chorismate lyase [Neisseria sp. N95_16]PJO79299.1 chorismate lyase [Neisseria sp. N177_16]QGL24561.1 chorismate lyase [Neisseria brasiliensis]
MVLDWRENCPVAGGLADFVCADSLTRFLSARGRFAVAVDALGLTQDPHLFADYALPRVVFQRRVTLLLDGVPLVHAQSVCAPQSLWCEHLDRGAASLGLLLFSNRLEGLTRSPLQFAEIAPYALARRSWFEWQGEKLFLSECFLPQAAECF